MYLMKTESHNKTILLFILIFLLAAPPLSYSQSPPPSATTSSLGEMFKKEEETREKRFKEKKRISPFKEEVTVGPPKVEEALPQVEKKILIKEIKIVGNTLISNEYIKAITTKYENKELSINDLKNLCNEITYTYINKGFITSGAYIPPQDILENKLTINIVEGMFGQVSIQGNRFFKSSSLKKYFDERIQKYLNLKDIEKAIKYLNKHPDRFVKATLMPGAKPDTTDVVLDVKDKNPWHFEYNFTNRGTKYTGKRRYTTTLRNTNLLGYDDFFTLTYQMGERDAVIGESVDYNFPINKYPTILGVYGTHLYSDLGRELKALDYEGMSFYAGAYVSHPLIATDTTKLDVRFAFDGKRVKNYILHELISHDELRVATLGLTFDKLDKFGRTIFDQAFVFGLPNILGAMKPKDAWASRFGAGGKFFKFNGTLTRVQKLPFSSFLLLTGRLQTVDDKLVYSEQMYIGGADTVRGYPELEFLGDYGYIVNTELRTPAFVIPRFIKLPFSHEPLKDRLQFAFFTDVGSVWTKNPEPETKKHNSLKGSGIGLRINLYDNLNGKIDWAFPLHKAPSDGSNSTFYFSLQWAPTDDLVSPEQLQANLALEEDERINKFNGNFIREELDNIDIKTLQELNDYYEEGLRLYENGQSKEAISLWQKIIDKRLSLYIEAKEKLNTFVEMKKEAKTCLEEGDKFFKEGKNLEAIESWKKVISIYEKSPIKN